MEHLWLFVNLIFVGLVGLLVTFVFVFWFFYLLRAILQKWKYYSYALRIIEYRNNAFEENTVVYNAHTEFVKCLFLFCMNIVEWMAFAINHLSYLLKVSRGDTHCQNLQHNNHTHNALEGFLQGIPCYISSTISNYDSTLHNVILLFGNNLKVLVLILIACLCEYLAGRTSRKSWLKSNNTLPLILIFVVYFIIVQFISVFCTIVILARCLNTLLLTASFVMALRQYKKLNMVIQWTITDLEISKENNKLLKRTVDKKKMFNRIFNFIWLGTIIIIIDECIRNSLLIAKIELSKFDYSSVLTFSLCDNGNATDSLPMDIIGTSLQIDNVIDLSGIFLFFIPYIGFGVYTIFNTMWGYFTGKTGYKTRYQYFSAI